MRQFFSGWRRRVGVVTLLMALSFLGGQIRSETYSDSFSFPFGTHTRASIDSENDYLFFECSTVTAQAASYPPHWSSLLACDPNQCYLFYRDQSVGWRFLCFAIGMNEIKPHARDDDEDEDFMVSIPRRIWFISYWSITTPLTLLSAYLLLSGLRVAKRKPASEG